MPYIDKNKVFWKEKDGIITLLMLDSGVFTEFNSVGSTIWKLLAEGLSAEEVIDSMAKIYDTPRERLAVDVHEFIFKMIHAGFMEA